MSASGWAFVSALAVVLLAFLSGLRKGKAKAEVKVAEAEQKAKVAEAEKQVVQETAKQVQEMTAEKEAIYGYFNEFEGQLAEARKINNTNYAIEAAQKLAERAREWQRRNP